ncbi:hypothetical protein FHS90_000238 [Rufibacter quisquiliarum]|uniref:Uncharacterized protein n=1 Tax=Rufibacter quisquiliarum TaxID=1549639 RepID=A0A839GNX3_9BACT|nr:hypothetical protein [Rufibacter quisquiliarum]
MGGGKKQEASLKPASSALGDMLFKLFVTSLSVRRLFQYLTVLNTLSQILYWGSRALVALTWGKKSKALQRLPV